MEEKVKSWDRKSSFEDYTQLVANAHDFPVDVLESMRFYMARYILVSMFRSLPLSVAYFITNPLKILYILPQLA